tara:strand:+ start:270 stop:497 length:228 start_codon:yes stop_codon:yes gene_type:complete
MPKSKKFNLIVPRGQRTCEVYEEAQKTTIIRELEFHMSQVYDILQKANNLDHLAFDIYEIWSQNIEKEIYYPLYD